MIFRQDTSGKINHYNNITFKAVVSSGSIDNYIMKLFHYLTNVNYGKRTALFQYAYANQREWTCVTVNLSALLMWRLLNKKQDTKINVNNRYANQLYITDDIIDVNKSTRALYNESPFALVHFKPADGVPALENYKLECVDEIYNPVKNSLGEVMRDAITNKVVAYDRTVKKAVSQYQRFREATVLHSNLHYGLEAPNLYHKPIMY